MISDCRFQCSRVGLEDKIYATPAGGILASQGTFSSFLYFSKLFMRQKLPNKIPHHCLQQFPLYQREGYVLFALKNACFVPADSVINVVYQYS